MAHNSKPLLAGLVLIGGLMLFARKGKAKSGVRAPLQLSKNFNLSEFVASPPGLKSYELSDQELENVTRLARDVLQPLRDKYGVISINSGGRPPSWVYPRGTTLDIDGRKTDVSGRTINEVLRLKGYKPADDSDHAYFGAADLKFADSSAYASAAIDAARNPKVRQVILEQAMRNGVPTITHLHVAVVMPGRPRLQAPRVAFVQLDGKTGAPIAFA